MAGMTSGKAPENSPLTSNGSVLICVTADEVNILQELSPQLLNNSKTSLTTDDSRCPVLQVGQHSTLAVPLQQFLADGYDILHCYQWKNSSILTWVIY